MGEYDCFKLGMQIFIQTWDSDFLSDLDVSACVYRLRRCAYRDIQCSINAHLHRGQGGGGGGRRGGGGELVCL